MKRYTAVELSRNDLKELAAHHPLWEDWAVENSDDMLAILEQSYCGKFNFRSAYSGYVGDLFVIQYDNLEVPPVSLMRAPSGKLETIDYIH